MSASMERLNVIDPEISSGTSIPFPRQEQQPKRPKPLRRWCEARRSISQSCKRAFQEAWHDLRSVKWHSQGLGCIAFVFIPGLVVMIISLSLLSGGVIGIDDNACLPDEKFSAVRKRFDWWAPKGFFLITIRMGEFDFAAAKLIDVAWDLIIGRVGQFPYGLSISWPSVISILRLLHQFVSKRGLASRAAMVFMIGAATLVLAFPTFAGSMSGYTLYSQAYVWTGDGYARFSKAIPVVYKIHNGDVIESSPGDPTVAGYDNLPRRWCEHWDPTLVEDDCSLQLAVSHYVQEYGFLSSWSEAERHRNDTYWNSTILSQGPLAVSPFYIPDYLNFYYNWFDIYNSTENASKASNKGHQDKMGLTYNVDGMTYNLTKLATWASCQSGDPGVSAEKYHWGFSFLQMFTMVILLLLWSIGIVFMGLRAHWTLILNEAPETSNGWKALLYFTEAMELELKRAGIDHTTLSDSQLNAEIQGVLQGGSISSKKPLEMGLYSLRKHGIPSTAREWGRRNRLWFLAVIACVPICIMQARIIGSPKSPVLAGTYGGYILVLAIMISSKKNLTVPRKVAWILFTCLVAFFIYLFVYLPYIAPGVLLGVALATGAGSTRRSLGVSPQYGKVGYQWLFAL
ncbi:hypothetical protein NM208_g11532 [Fusarium decemcellulare]|uniref:Uncharacterized protein n=1 Tax=Fusarium decemcellulare TaxID=57161 RepID=A0ACC1RS94_9HYPO|nr:hypothetical protein NM208_g11532 [Fusarium decemcellulare]